MKVIILENFEGWPDPAKDDQPGVHYKADPEEIEVPAEFGKLIVAKGHARAGQDGAAASLAEPSPIAPRKRSGDA